MNEVMPPRRPGDGAGAESGTNVVNVITNSTVHGSVVQGGTVHLPPPPPPEWPVSIGVIPILASAFQPRTAVREAIDQVRAGNETVVLSQVLAGGGGVGKSQLAAHYAWQALEDGVDVVVWAAAADPVSVLLAYAEAAAAVQLPGATNAADRVDQDARRFLNWLSSTERSWLVVLDDVTDFTATGPLWPGRSRRGNGRVLATTRQRGAHASGGGRAVVPVDVYDTAEAVAYLRERLTGAGYPYLLDPRAEDLAEALGRLPLALAHAAAYMVNQQRTCTAYLDLFRERTRTLDAVLPPEADTELYGRPVAAALLISLDAAQQTEPKGLAVPAVRLAALLDPAGHPRELWTTDAVTEYLAKQRAAGATGPDSPPRAGGPDAEPAEPGEPPPVSADEALTALAVLHTYNLISSYPAGVDLPHRGPVAAHREVSIHALTARAARDTTPEPTPTQSAVMFAMYQLWPAEDHLDHRLAASLRANTATLRDTVGSEVLRLFPGFALRDRAGLSLLAAGLHTEAVDHWEEEVEANLAELGPEDQRTLISQANLAAAYEQAGRATDAVVLRKRVAVEHERLFGADSPETLDILGSLAASYTQIGFESDAVTLKEHVLAARERVLGPLHSDTVNSRNNLALTYEINGRYEEALALKEQVVVELANLLGAQEHPRMLIALASLASSYAQAGRLADAMEIEENVLEASERILGPDHPDTMAVRVSLASSYAATGRGEEALALRRQAVADQTRVQGPEHPDTLKALADLSVSCRRTGRHDEAVEIAERVLPLRSRVLGRDHPDTLISAANLVNAYATAGRPGRALKLAEALRPHQERVFGPHDDSTLAGRHAVALLRVLRGESVLAEDPARAAKDAELAIEAVGPHVEPRLPALDEALEDARRLAEAARAALRAREGAPGGGGKG
ncbi:tetratricopeptide repeat protein [Kitasatospora xanthocidica]|uniref:tetratricopeptide repeat protein n=1 Tax=Kitasatospora xanthocidica TaxID=83382 RepID=UPI00167204C9|nr:tetratricopeptide repeat protein [Kitasatospora xanthocidica]GHF38273.1 tetratricopeptide repeat protein [Kitasatospora xanthocidica]